MAEGVVKETENSDAADLSDKYVYYIIRNDRQRDFGECVRERIDIYG